MTDMIRVLRVLEYIGPRHLVEQTLRRGGVPANGEHTVTIHGGTPHDPVPGVLRITSALVGAFGDVLHVIDAPQMDSSTESDASAS